MICGFPGLNNANLLLIESKQICVAGESKASSCTDHISLVSAGLHDQECWWHSPRTFQDQIHFLGYHRAAGQRESMSVSPRPPLSSSPSSSPLSPWALLASSLASSAKLFSVKEHAPVRLLIVLLLEPTSGGASQTPA